MEPQAKKTTTTKYYTKNTSETAGKVRLKLNLI